MTLVGRASRALVVGAAALVASRSPVSTAVTSASEDKVTRQSLERARVAYNLRDYAEASAQWQSAYRASKLAVLLFNIGQAERLQKHYEEAYHYYDVYLAEQAHTEGRPPLNDDEARSFRDQMKGMMDECKEHPRRHDCKRPKAAVQPGSHDSH
jgi:tetratricopeptide (TPR) repeat protein